MDSKETERQKEAGGGASRGKGTPPPLPSFSQTSIYLCGALCLQSQVDFGLAVIGLFRLGHSV